MNSIQNIHDNDFNAVITATDNYNIDYLRLLIKIDLHVKLHIQYKIIHLFKSSFF